MFHALWAKRTWLSTICVLSGLPVAALSFYIILMMFALLWGTAVLVVTLPFMLGALFAASRMLTRWQRSRFAAFMDVRLGEFPRPERQTYSRRALAEAGQGSSWSQVVFHFFVNLLISCVTFTFVVTFWCIGLTYSTIFAHGWLLPEKGQFGWDVHSPKILGMYTTFGLIFLLAAPWIARGAAALELGIAKGMLAPSKEKELAQRVDTLTESRAAVVDAADAERRRIERDLHDGAQQRLVSLAMNLGISRASMSDAPPEARKAIEEAHEEAKQALVEMRDFVRGLHPAVLNDRGLDAALSGIAARSPVPVQLTVNVEKRPSSTIEAVAYFVVSEALTNIAKHARATRASVDVIRRGDFLHIQIHDDGQGGASPTQGTGLLGLAQRVASVDGTLHLESPIGGPTTIEAELPCA